MIFDRPRSHARGLPSPLVEAVTKHQGEWTVTESVGGRGSTDNKNHTMRVPLADEVCVCGKDHGEFVRSHELLHSKLSPEDRKPTKVKYGEEIITVAPVNIQVAEEMRVNFSLARIEDNEILLEEGYCQKVCDDNIAGAMDGGKYADIIRLAVIGPGYDAFVKRSLEKYHRSALALIKAREAGAIPKEAKVTARKRIKIASHLIDAINAYNYAGLRCMLQGLGIDTGTCDCDECQPVPKDHLLPPWSATEKFAAYLEVNLSHMDEQLEKLFGDPEPDLDRILGAEFEGLYPTEGIPKSKSKSKDGADFVAGDSRSGSGETKWGKVTKGITRAEMPLAMAPWKLQKANRAVDEGTIPRYMHRWPSDKRVFHRSKKLPGGSVVIDDSGSMGLNATQLSQMVDAAPAATVAIYAGNDGYNGGEIRIVAEKGKRARPENLSIEEYGGNGIDGPALEWLGTQPEPRVWITDGGVTAIDGGVLGVREAAKQLCRKYKITAVETAEEAAQILKKGYGIR